VQVVACWLCPRRPDRSPSPPPPPPPPGEEPRKTRVGAEPGRPHRKEMSCPRCRAAGREPGPPRGPLPGDHQPPPPMFALAPERLAAGVLVSTAFVELPAPPLTPRRAKLESRTWRPEPRELGPPKTGTAPAVPARCRPPRIRKSPPLRCWSRNSVPWRRPRCSPRSRLPRRPHSAPGPSESRSRAQASPAPAAPPRPSNTFAWSGGVVTGHSSEPIGAASPG